MEYIAVIVPSLGVGVLFYFAMKAIFNADRAEREALAQAEREAEHNSELPSNNS
ncbi:MULTISPECIES: hypothetical protein [unclassified Arthrobacter]|uniref:hypothetical protein n=1 Tax=unclassified Arthrobacter TaxID=235627 RepID=UPI00159D2240|nr:MULTISPECIES: hypothetical protein [unclassified Arthrobacter]MCQ9162588.1 hypothetical protein [Arthrobacter sp. STN4]NVM98382.1 hypothetical protein [Arthrobacter sp. SDTb3-6]